MAEKYGWIGNPVSSRTRVSAPAATSSLQRSAVRVSCQTIAFAIGMPVARSQTTIVSRWFVIPTPATRPMSTSAEHLAGAGGDRLEDLERIVLDEARLRVVLAMWQLPLGDPVARTVDERGPARGRALVEGEDEIGGDGPSLDDSCRR